MNVTGVQKCLLASGCQTSLTQRISDTVNYFLCKNQFFSEPTNEPFPVFFFSDKDFYFKLII
jgi:hypothetical protein